MPAKSKAQRRLMAMALHHPEMLNKSNMGVESMGKDKLREFASTSEKDLPKKRKGYGVGAK